LAFPKSPSPADVAAARVARLATRNPSGVVDVVPITFAFGWRMSTEETALSNALGTPYVNYMRRTKRLVPFAY